jgi:hypothetical protein
MCQVWSTTWATSVNGGVTQPEILVRQRMCGWREACCTCAMITTIYHSRVSSGRGTWEGADIIAYFPIRTWNSWWKTSPAESSVLVSILLMGWGGAVQLCGPVRLPLLFPTDISPTCTLPRTSSEPPPVLVLSFSMIARVSGLVMHEIILILHSKAVSRTLPLNLQFPFTCLIWFTNTASPCS